MKEYPGADPTKVIFVAAGSGTVNQMSGPV
jgi:hypothetical protein